MTPLPRRRVSRSPERSRRGFLFSAFSDTSLRIGPSAPVRHRWTGIETTEKEVITDGLDASVSLVGILVSRLWLGGNDDSTGTSGLGYRRELVRCSVCDRRLRRQHVRHIPAGPAESVSALEQSQGRAVAECAVFFLGRYCHPGWMAARLG